MEKQITTYYTYIQNENFMKSYIEEEKKNNYKDISIKVKSYLNQNNKTKQITKIDAGTRWKMNRCMFLTGIRYL